jgi:hypothetical protein
LSQGEDLVTLPSQATRLPDNLVIQLNCEVYLGSEYLGLVIPTGAAFMTEYCNHWDVYSKGGAIAGVAETKELGMLILYLQWFKTSKRLEGIQ